MLQILLGALGVKAAGEDHLPKELGQRLPTDVAQFRADFDRGPTGGGCRMVLERFVHNGSSDEGLRWESGTDRSWQKFEVDRL